MHRAVAVAAALGLVAYSAGAADVKGLRLGAPTTPQQLAQQFGSADCPDDLVADAMRKMGVTRCTVPLSYLGIQTSADVYIYNGAVGSVRIRLPRNLNDQVSEFFASKYGQPTSHAPNGCSEWRNVEESDLKLCATSDKLEVTFSYSPPSVIDPNDT